MGRATTSGKDDKPSAPDNAAAETRPGRSRRVLIALFLLAAAVFGAPPVVARVAPLRNGVVRWLMPKIDGEVTVGAANFNWLQPVELRDIVVSDASGEKLLEILIVTGRRQLWQLCLNSSQAGAFHCQGPHAWLVFRPEGSNLEDLLAPVLADKTPGKPLSFSLLVEKGTIELRDAGSDRTGMITDLKLAVEQTGSGTEALRLEGESHFGESGSGGQLAWKWDPAAELAPASDPASPAGISLQAERFELAQLAPLFARGAAGLDLSGVVTGTLQSHAADEQERNRTEVTGKLQIRNLSLTANGMRNGEHVQLDSLDLAGKGTFDSKQFALEQLRLNSDIARGEIRGSLDRAALAESQKTGHWDEALRSLEIHLDGTVDLPQLVAMLPTSLNLRHDVEISRGTLQTQVRTTTEGARKTWQAGLNLADFAARVGGRPVTWEQPVELALLAHAEKDQLSVEKLTGRSDFFQLAAKGDRQAGRVRMRCDLDDFAQRLGQFVDLEGSQLAGIATLDAQWTWPASGALQVEVKGTAENLAIATPGRRPWHEQKLDLHLSMEGQSGESQRTLETGSLTVNAAGDKLELSLREPVSLHEQNSTGEIAARITGNLVRWVSRIPADLVPPEWQLDGGIQGEANLSVSRQSIGWSNLRVDLEQLKIDAGDWMVAEPVVKLESQGTWDLAQGHLNLPSAAITSRIIAARLQEIAWQGGGTSLPVASGTVAFQSDLGRLAACFPRDKRATGGKLAGQAKGRFKVSQADSVTKFSGQVHSDELIVGSSAHAASAAGAVENSDAAQSGPLNLTIAGSFDRDRDTLDLEQAAIETEGLKLTARGRIADLSTRRALDLNGNLGFDWERLAPLLQSFVGSDVQLAGAGERTWSLTGPLAPPRVATRARPASLSRNAPAPAAAPRVADDLTGAAALDWTEARAFGLTLGPAELDAHIRQGELAITPLHLAVGDGKLHLAPRLSLNREPLTLTLEKGALAEQLHITPELCAGWLRFVAPLLAEATEAEGRFSTDLEHAAFPIAQLERGDAAGVLSIHSAQVLPGGFARQLVDVGRQVEAILRRQPQRSGRNAPNAVLELPEQQVEFTMREGRVEHRGLTMQSGDVTIRTRGVVGVDESLALVAEIPIPEDWVARDRYLKGLKGQVVQIPIGGTLKRPQIDTRTLNRLAEQIAGSAAGSAIEGVLDDQLKRLFQRAK